MTTPLASPCAVKPAITAKPRTVSVNGIAISRAAIGRETQNHPAAKPIEAWQAAARALAVRELLLQEARRLALQPDPAEDEEGRRETDEEALIRQLVAQEIVTPEADEAACRRYFDANRQRFQSPAIIEARHILLPAGPKDEVARAEARRHAALLILQIQQEPTCFADLAAAVSACPSGKTGGHLGQIGPGQTVPEFETALGHLPVGTVGEAAVETRYGLHVVWVERRIPGQQLPFEVVRQRIGAWLGEKVRRLAIQQYITILAGRAEITGVEIASSPSPLVQ
ncbi:peptidylprolyl isomerase [Bosea psychrotolerans]|uniref:Parvulin-like PPIase n=1 Tax=Bosea psychrotolerans TaxID=1871628 RepID=A0A2S4LSK5_9HYPH|nr:peptidylprolyl isomerase [Bosea psychrotolerans]POR45414.1 peptidyl-prolyl cis-trans isomerase C [Bosea psychrotolerans]